MTTPPRFIRSQPSVHSLARSPFSSSYLSASPIAQESIARDLADDDQGLPGPESPFDDDDDDSEASTVRPDAHQHSMATSYRRPSLVSFGSIRPAVAPRHADPTCPTKKEKEQARNEERSLLRDNRLGKFSGRAIVSYQQIVM